MSKAVKYISFVIFFSQVNIVCPLYDQRTNPNEEETEKFVIYHVKKEEYDTCQIMSAHPRILAQCDKPYSLRYFTISFRPFSPTPGALEFHPGKDYYFISTSSKTDLHRRVDGMCRTNNMRIVFKVADKSWHQNHKNRKDFQSSTVTMSTTTAILTSTTELSLDMEETKAIENLNVTNPYMDIDELETVDDDEKQKKKKKRKKKKKQRKDKKNNKTDVEGEERESVVQEEDVLMNDNPPNQVRQMEPSLVEKVNNLMKQEASISAAKPKVISNQHILISFALILTVLQPLLF